MGILQELIKLNEEKFEAGAKRFADALVELVRDEDDPELSEDELKAEIDRVAKKYGLTGAERKRLALACEGPIGN